MSSRFSKKRGMEGLEKNDGSAKELLHGSLPSLQLGHDLTHDSKHGHAPVVDLLGSHLWGELLPLERVAEAARLALLRLPGHRLMASNEEDEQGEPLGSLGSVQRLQASRHVLEARELHEVCEEGASGGHHGEPSVLNLRCAQVLEASGVPREGHESALGEAERIKESQWHSHARLLLRDQGYLRSIEAETSLVILGQDTCPRHLLLAAPCRGGAKRENPRGGNGNACDLPVAGSGRGPSHLAVAAEGGDLGLAGTRRGREGRCRAERGCGGAGGQGSAPPGLRHHGCFGR
mmetsp:Transcript_64120/g.142597  ORF Transcript_64120/g.142597 Transcript_64120/m.142597 type:complete len:291 (-) Transcript_64120:42-914(-)